jgi:hypothetical protein
MNYIGVVALFTLSRIGNKKSPINNAPYLKNKNKEVPRLPNNFGDKAIKRKVL